jgi:F1F0 ATPase subunit 2
MNWIGSVDVAVYLTAGAGLGAVYFAVLLRTVRLHASQAATVRTIPLYLTRVAVAAVVFWAIAQQGAVPLLLALLGFLIARTATQYWIKWG